MTPRESIVPIFVPHLGCPYNCIFCDQNRITGKQKPVSSEDVTKEIIGAINRTPNEKNRQVAFYGGSFTAVPVQLQDNLLESVQPFIKNGEISSIRLSTRPDAINDDILLRLKKYNVRTIELGAQSLDDNVLKLTKRGHSENDIIKSSKLIKSYGFRLILQMMTGLPGETKEISIETARKIIDLEPNGVRIYPTVIVKDTELYDEWIKGNYKEHTVEDAVDTCCSIVQMFDNANIPIIRLGLNPTEGLSGGDAVGGAYHPALGELVKSRIMLDKTRNLLINDFNHEHLVLGVSKSSVSKMIGQHKINIETLKTEFNIKRITIKQIEINDEDVIIL